MQKKLSIAKIYYFIKLDKWITVKNSKYSRPKNITSPVIGVFFYLKNKKLIKNSHKSKNNYYFARIIDMEIWIFIFRRYLEIFF